MRHRLRVLAVVGALAILVMGGCANLPYYLQSVRGQLDIWSRQHDIQALIDQPDTAEPLRKKLEAVLEIREFASGELSLPRNASYRQYANLERPFVAWNVFATPEFSIEPRQWCFLFAGCVKYRGYFSREDAEHFAAGVAGEGFDVYVGGVPAYSLLGYFPDPVLNTFIHYPVPHLARLIFHELAHQVVYVRDDSVFNESFAVAVEQEGLRRWLIRFGSEADRKLHQDTNDRRAGFVALIGRYRDRLEALYASGAEAAAMRTRKAELFAEMQRDYSALKASWGGFAGYDRWFAQPPNNALLASVGIYTQYVPAFQALLEKEGSNLPRFYEAVRDLSRLKKTERAAALNQLMPPIASASAH